MIENPLRQLLDAVALSGSRPPAAELDATIADVLREDLGPSTVTPTQLRHDLTAVIEDAVSAVSEGDRGRARQLTREAHARLEDQLPAYQRPDPSAGKSMREVVDSIPRGIR